jgi:murein L,D-transpeptidase YafK
MRALPLGRPRPTLRGWPYVLASAIALIAIHRIGYERAAGTIASFARPAPTTVDDTRSLQALCAAASVPYPPPDVRIVVEKQSRTLTLYSGSHALAHYRVGLGFDPVGGKLREGDGRTPEGELTIVTRNEKSRFRKFLGLSYPRPADVNSSLTPQEVEAIKLAFADRVKPPWDTPLGGAVGIHGHGSRRDWTAGCVAVDDSEIDVLWEAAPLGTPVTIRP